MPTQGEMLAACNLKFKNISNFIENSANVPETKQRGEALRYLIRASELCQDAIMKPEKFPWLP